MNNKIDVLQFDEVGYAPVVTFDAWRVAMLNYIDELLPQHITSFQKHDLTDEAFILLNGKCILFIADTKDDVITHIEAIEMTPNKIYNIKKGVYHTHTLSENGKVLIVENDNTCDENSPVILTTPEINQKLVELTKQLWK